MYQEMHMWEEAIEVAEVKVRSDAELFYHIVLCFRLLYATVLTSDVYDACVCVCVCVCVCLCVCVCMCVWCVCGCVCL